MRIVTSLGSTALLDRGERVDAAVQRRHVRRAAGALSTLGCEHHLLICHGNGEQVGTLALESENDGTLTRPYPLDILGAGTQGMIGYLLVQELRRAGVERPLAALVTQAVVDRHDPGFRAPSAFVGPGYTRDQIQLWAGELGWQIAYDGSEWRRVVPRPAPVEVLELPLISTLVEAGALVVCGGGGGVPVCAEIGGLGGVEALVDPDLTASLIAVELDADRLLLLTDVSEVRRDWGTPAEQPLRRVSLADLDGISLEAGTMATKVAAARRFVESTGRPALIGALNAASDVVAGRSGTAITAF